ncbi:4Fe-4S binding protein [Crenobacter luteus]|uniref:4Fe-4S binding protein n=1 Tax=Crenobacter luteus TaxID=1452487 RepID=UPI0010DB3118|nr:4Fe-4S binding protein [Crenobacter luteus]TCP11575.1 4Fe-4S binding protein [Crenobacter luteus]
MSQTLARAGHWMRAHAPLIRKLQWLVVLAYAVLVGVPAFLPLPDDGARVFNNLTVFAQFVFWGIWWPFVLLSMVLFGRLWCGVLCPEGALAEFASGKGLNRAIPRWMRWGGWPFVAFALTTLYGQLVSVYQYPKAVLLVLGGSTLAAIVVGFVYGREKRVWCKYLCPVNGVFGLLAKLAPLHYKVDAAAWRASSGKKVIPINCAPLVAIRHMEGASDCHQCGRCSGYRGAVSLAARSPNAEVVAHGEALGGGWQTALLLLGLLGIAIGGFHWTVSPWFVALKQGVAEWLIERDILWPLDIGAPWFILTDYPELNDRFTLLDGATIVAYMLGTGVAMATGLSVCLALATRVLGPWRRARFHHLVQALIPAGGCSVFLGLSALTVTMLKHEGVPLDWVAPLRFGLLAGANLWSLVLAWQIAARHSRATARRLGALAGVALALALVDLAWWLMFVAW